MLNTSLKLGIKSSQMSKKKLLKRLIGIKLFSLLYVVFVSCDLSI